MAKQTTWQAVWSIPVADFSAVYGALTGTFAITANVLAIPYQGYTNVRRHVGIPTSHKSIQAACGTFKAEDPGVGVSPNIFRSANTAGTEVVAFRIVRVSSTTYTVSLIEAAGVLSAGSTVFSYGTSYPWLLEQDGTTWRLWWGSSTTPECSGANANQTLNFGAVDKVSLGDYQVSSGDVTKNLYYSPIWIGSYDAYSDRPDPAGLSFDKLGIESGTPLFAGWASGTGAGDYAEADDWLTGAHDSDTTYWGHAGVAGTQYDRTAETTNPTVTSPLSLAIYFVSRVAFGAKNNTIGSIITDGGSNTVYSTREAEAGATYVLGHRYLHATDPAGAAWAAAGLNSLEIGASTIVDAAQANGGRLTAIQGEVIGLGAGFAPDVPAATSSRRRVGPALGSANPMIC